MRGFIIGIVALAFGAAAFAQNPIKDESVLVPLPDGFKLGFQQQAGTMHIAELVPKNETVENWTSMVTILTFKAKPPSLESFVNGMSQRYASACGTQETTKIGEDAATNGYPSGVWRLVCEFNPGTRKPEYMYMKLIMGDDAFYSVQYAFRDAPSPERNTAAEAHMATVGICDPRKQGHPCPDTEATNLPQ